MGKSTRSTGKPSPFDIIEGAQASKKVIEQAEGAKPLPGDIIGADNQKKNSGGSDIQSGGSDIQSGSGGGMSPTLMKHLIPDQPDFSKIPSPDATSQLPKEVKPSQQAMAIDLIKQDYVANKATVDPFFTNPTQIQSNYTAPIIPGAKGGTVLPMMDESVIKKVLDPYGDPNILTKYREQRFRDLDNELTTRQKEIEQKYPENFSSAELGGNIRPREYDDEISALRNDINARKEKLADAIGTMASIQVINKELAQRKTPNAKLDVKKIGREVRKAVGDPTVDKDIRYERKGITLDPASSYYNDVAGFNAIATALEKMDEDGSSAANDRREVLAQNLKDSRDKLFNDHSDFRKKQVARAISDKIYKDKNWFQTMTGAYTINNDDIKRAASELGIPEKYIQDIDKKDIKTANIFGTFLNEIAVRPGANLGAAGGRLVRKYLLGQDPDQVDAHYDQLKKSFTTYFADAPDAQAQFGSETRVQSDPTKPNFLEDVKNNKAGRFNWNIDAIANTVSEGIAQMTQYGLGATGAGKVIQKLGMVNDFDKARKAGLVTYGFLTAYDDSYGQARQVVGDDPKNELARNAFATIRALTSAYTELIFPDYKVTDNLFGVNTKAGKQLIDKLAKDGLKGLTQTETKSLIVNGLKETLKDTGKEVLEEEADLLGDVVASSIFNPSSLSDRNIPQEAIQTAVTMAISAAVPIGLGQMRKNNQTSPIKKAMVYNIGSSPAEYQNNILSQLDSNQISQELANKKMAVVNTMADIVQKEIPEVSPVNNMPLSEKDKIEYSYNLLHDKMLQERISNTTDEVQIKMLEEKRNDLKTEREAILGTVDGIERNFVGQPIYERDFEEETEQSILDNQKADIADIDQRIQDLNKDDLMYEENLKSLEQEKKDVNDYYESRLRNIPDNKKTSSDGTQQGQEEPSEEQSSQQGKQPASDTATAEASNEQTLPEGKGDEQELLNNEEEASDKTPAPSSDLSNQEDVSDDILPQKQREKVKSIKEKGEYDYYKEVFDKTRNINPEDYGLEEMSFQERKELPPHQSGKMYKGEASGLNEFEKGDTIVDAYKGRAYQVVSKKSSKSKNYDFDFELKDLTTGETSTIQSAKGRDGDVYLPINKKGAKKETPAPAAKRESPKADVFYGNLSNISTDVSRFQPRATEFSQSSVDKIVNDYDQNKLDPVVLYQDANGKDYVLAGHSRLEAHRQLSAMPETDPRRQKAEANGFVPGQIKSRYFTGTEEEAIEFADRSNDLGTKNKDFESANSLRNMKASKSKIQERAKTDFGKNWRYIYMLSRLNPNGKMIQLVKSLADSPDIQTENEIKKAAQWIGSVRSSLEDMITNAHEDEMTDFLLDKTNAKKFTRETDFLQFINNITGGFTYDNSLPLNLERTKLKTTAEVIYENERDHLENDINAKQKEYDRINERLNNPSDKEYISPSDPDYSDVLQVADLRKAKLSEELAAMRRQLQELKGNKGAMLSRGIGQIGLFESANITSGEKEQLNEEIEEDNIDLNKIEEYETAQRRTADSSQDTEQGIGNAEEAEPVQETVQQSEYDESGSENEDQGSGAVQGRQRATESVNNIAPQYDKKNESTEPAPTESQEQTPEERKRAALEKAKAEFAASFKKNRGQLNIGIDPDLLAKGIQLVGAYVDLGVYKFGEIVRDVADSLGEKSEELLDAIKKVYGAYLATNENPELDDISTVRAFRYENITENAQQAVADTTEQGEADEMPAENQTEEEFLQQMIDEAPDTETRDYYQQELNLLNNDPFMYWKQIYDATNESDQERKQEAYDNALKSIKPGDEYTFESTPDFPEKVVSVNDEGVELVDKSGYANFNTTPQNFIEKYSTYRPGAIAPTFGQRETELHPFVKGVMDKVVNLSENEALIDIQRAAYDLAGDRLKAIRQEIYSSLTGKKETRAASGVNNIAQELKKLYYGTRTSTDMESDSARSGSENGLGETLFSATRNSNRPAVDGDADQIIETGVPIQGSPGLLPFDATISGERSNTELFGEEQSVGSQESPAGDTDTGRSSESDDDGISFEPDGEGDIIEDVTEGSGLNFEELRQLQNKAEGTPYRALDLKNIAASLPLLLPGQMNDVYKAEDRFINHVDKEDLMYGKGILFTNGTGTGKTLTGGGIAKRFIQQGKKQITIIVPSDTKAKDWIEELAWLNIPVRQLNDTKDSGDGVLVTTYANMRDNINLQQRDTDLVIYDESHKINSNGAGSTTSSENAHKAMTKTPSIALRQAKDEFNFYAEQSRLRSEGKYDEAKALEQQVMQRAKQIFNRTKVVFLFATPFSYHKSLGYADGYLYSIRENFNDVSDYRGYNQGTDEDIFYMTNFGYRMRYNKLTKPETGVDIDLLERQFTENLKNKGIISSRKLDIDKDYSRQFIISSSEVGKKIDEGLSIARDRDKYKLLPSAVDSRMNFLYTNQLMEAIKAKESIDRYKQHLALGRKIVVFHNYIENQPGHPFDFLDPKLYSGLQEDQRIQLFNEIARFNEENPEYRNLDLKGLKSPIQTLQEAFPGRVVLFNGREKKADRSKAVKLFNDDNSGIDIIIVQTEAGKEGISLHDKTGKRQRVESNLGLPYAPTTAIQAEGRVYRTGNKTNAVIEYPILNLNFERFAFASKISERVRTAENFAMGEEARNMELAFKEGYVNATEDLPGDYQGTGGKQDDARADKSSEFDKARTYYFKRAKRNARQKSNVEGDYYATPEPLGYKMVEWSHPVSNEKMLEPSAGHGAIARFFSKANRNVFIEPNNDLRSEVALNANGQVHAGTFEDLNIINKFDVIVMNPPFGHAGKTAMDHMEKAMIHLRDGGRITALVPVGQMDERINKWLESDASKNFHIRAKIKLPSVTFERAGTKVNTQIIIIDRINDAEKAKELGPQINRDLSRYDNITDFFEAIRDMEIPERLMPGVAAAQEEEEMQSNITSTRDIVSDDVDYGSMEGGDNTVEVIKGVHTKKGTEIFTARVNKRISQDEFALARNEAKKLNGYYSSYKGSGAIPGFIFDNQQNADRFAAMINGKGQESPSTMSIAERIRSFKIGKDNAYSMILPIPPIWNAAVEIVAKAVEAGEALVDAMRKGMDYINKNNKKEWNKNVYNKEMINALKDRGVFSYNLSPAQMNEADRVIKRVMQGSNIVKEMAKIREKYDQALSTLTDPADIADLNDNYNEMDRYMFNTLAINNIEENTNDIDLDLRNQTWWEKQKENWQNRFQRVEQVQKKISDLGITIEEKNDMVNRADRWKSIAAVKIDDVLKEIGLRDVDVFAWKGRKKIDDSLFDKMAKKGIDYRKFNLYLYAKHAEERNAHNAKMRREALEIKLVELESEVKDLKDKLQLQPSPTTQGLLTRKENELAQFVEYRDAYSDPSINRNYVKALEKKIAPKFRLMDDGGSGMLNDQAQEILQAVQDEGLETLYSDFELMVREKIIDKVLDNQMKYGLISQEDYDQINGYYNNYVPLKVDNKYFEDEVTFAQSGLPGAKIFKSKGANYIDFENRVNPLTQALIDLQAVFYEGEQNEFKKTIANTILSASDNKVWELKNAEYAPVKDKRGRILQMREVNVPENGIPYNESGSKKYLIINDQALAKELTGENVKAAIPVLSKINAVFRSVYTVYNPSFTITNLFRDMETAGIVMGTTQKADVRRQFKRNAAQAPRLIKGSYMEQNDDLSSEWAKIAREYKDLGGNMTWFTQETSSDMVEDIEAAYQKYQKSGGFEAGKNLAIGVADWMTKASQAVETATRLAMYDALVKSGVEKYKAVEIARNATINFNKKGNFAGITDSLYLFANATIQGTTNVLKTMLTTKRGRYMAGGIVMMGFLQSLINSALDDCEGDPANCYDNVPDYEKERFIIIKNPAGKGFIKIPLAYGFNVFYNFGERMAQMIQGKQNPLDAATNILSIALNSFNPAGTTDTPVLQQISPTATDPIVQWFTNRDGLGRKIYPDNEFDHSPDSQKTTSGDTPQSKAFTKWLNETTGGNEKVKGKIDVAPGTLDWIFETATGGLGQFIKQGVGSTMDAFDPNVDVDPKKIPIINRFYTTPKEKNEKGDIYETRDRSYNEYLSPKQIEDFNRSVDNAIKTKQLDPEKGQTYKEQVQRNQFRLNNQGFLEILDRSKVEELPPEEIDAFVMELEERAMSGEIPEKWVKSYKSQISRNQNKLYKRNNPEEE